jgi:NADH dehydrogenase
MPRDPTGSERKDMINKSDLVVVGAGFAGVWAAAAAAALRDDIGVAPGDFPITVVSPGGDLVIRPRLYQSEP